ncbi:alpha/beta fold hydrolase [Vagococcus xieshaowenii]|uniref:Alpha/beta fold hydrolase n=1 Tax=Vagococcus xieshaowenii TaxID=2562451 RepID=A0AAJ5JLW7_9ENTE|nr:alpha/beta fold hydrolase [Vagococcus xieshaowenii]QCA28789.1 alpha/beta fold hydrolase [Vagococcus xieshaowenii]TFZ43010.1 alpha/beta fold hydrolase [Vagococcus xieshaowenii]
MRKDFYVSSSNKQHDLHVIAWLPNYPPKGIIQLVHGMAEYVERYEPFANFLIENGWGILGHDHLGHGQSVKRNTDYGFFDKHHGADVLISDTYLMTKIIKEKFPTTKIILLGHSMGSLIARNYLKRYSSDVDAAIIMGTTSGRLDLTFGLSLAKQLNRLAPKKTNIRLNQLAFGSFHKNFPESSTFNWLSKNQDNVHQYELDKLTGFTFTNNGFYTLFQLTKQANEKNWANDIRTNLPILVISGEKDPVGDFGKGPRKVAFDLRESGKQKLTLHLYQELRHELLNEEENELIMHDLLGWIEKHA